MRDVINGEVSCFRCYGRQSDPAPGWLNPVVPSVELVTERFRAAGMEIRHRSGSGQTVRLGLPGRTGTLTVTAGPKAATSPDAAISLVVGKNPRPTTAEELEDAMAKALGRYFLATVPPSAGHSTVTAGTVIRDARNRDKSMDGTQRDDTAGSAEAAPATGTDTVQAEFQWVVRVDLPEVTEFEQADLWMDVVSTVVYRHDSGFSGLISVTREPVNPLDTLPPPLRPDRSPVQDAARLSCIADSVSAMTGGAMPPDAVMAAIVEGERIWLERQPPKPESGTC